MKRYGPVFLLSVFLACLYIAAQVCRNRVVEKTGLEGLASWYEPGVNSEELVCALRVRQPGKIYRVRNLENNKSVVVRHSGWGPDLLSFQKGRVIDLSKAAFAQIADPASGLARVSVIEEKPAQEQAEKRR